MRLLLASALLAASLAACTAEAEKQTAHSGETVTDSTPTDVIGLRVEDVAALRNAGAIPEGQMTLVDVRRPDETGEGYIGGAILMPLDTFQPAQLIERGSQNVVFYCRSGRRSAIAAARYAQRTGKPAQHMEGGILAWQEAGQPVFQSYVIE